VQQIHDEHIGAITQVKGALNHDKQSVKNQIREEHNRIDKSRSIRPHKKMLHISNAENIETETSKDGFDLGEESSNKTEAKDEFGTFEAENVEEKKPVKTKKDVIQKRISVNKAKIEKL
tara:strand:+ start:438 stop:794 length:357 start_codon:yes stop_codon:yes gene_type:complete